MTGPAPLTSVSWLTAWSLDVPIVVLVVVVTAGYLMLAHRQPEWPVGRVWAFLAAMCVVVLATCSFLGTYAHSLFWVLAAQDVLLATLAPVPLVLSRPLLLLGWTPRPRRGSRTAFLGSFLVVAVLSAVYASGLDEARLRSFWLFVVLQVVLVGCGSAFAGPLFTGNPSSYGVRVVAAFLDGLLDAIPGLVVLARGGRIAASYYASAPRRWGPTPSWDQQIGGSLILVLSEAVGVPVILLVLVRWVRCDVQQAKVTDTALDAEGERHPADKDALQRPWWETAPGPLADRMRRRGGGA